MTMAGPYKTIDDSCAAARPCGFTDTDTNGNDTTPAKTPDCDAVLDQHGSLNTYRGRRT